MGLTKDLGALPRAITVSSANNVGIGVPSPVTQLNVGNSSHGIGISYLGASSLPSIAGLFTDTGINGGQGYGDLQIKSRSDFSGYSINFFTAATANTPSPRMRIASNGNVLIGTTTDNGSKVNISGILNVTGGVTFANDSGQGLQLVALTDTQRGLYMGYNYSGNYAQIEAVHQGVAYKNIIISPNGGNIGIGTTNPNGYLAGTIGSVIYHTSSPARSLANSSAYWLNYLSGTEYRFWNSTNGVVHTLYLNGNYSFLGTNVSDIRLKEDIEDLNINYTEKILSLNPKSYFMKESRNRKHYGFIAQEVYETIPDIISGDIESDDYLGVDYNGIIAILVGSIKELTARLETLENK